MSTVTASNGNVYHVYALPDLSTPEPSDTLTFTTLKNDLGDGYSSSVLFGSNTGLRSWKLKWPTLAGTDINIPTVTDINGATVTRERYLRSLFIENKVTGTPFAYPDPSSGQYYLVDFDEDDMTMDRMRVKIYSTGLTLKQRRLQGVTVFSVSRMGSATGILASNYDNDHAATQWREHGYGSNWGSFIPSGDVVFSANPQNGLNTVRFSGSASTGVAALDAGGTGSYYDAYDIFLVMKMREATFSNAAGILTGTTVGRVLIGSSGTALFADLSHTNYEYRLNDILYAQSAQAAPMNTWGIVHLRFTVPFTIDRWQLGKDRATAGTFAKMDIGELLVFHSLLPTYQKREVLEYLQVKWGIT